MRKAIALVTASAIAAGAVLPARSQVLEGFSLASTLISMGGRGSDPSLTAIMAQMRMLEAMGQRLTAIEGTLTLIMQKLDALPAEMRKALAEDADRDRVERTVSAISNLKTYVAGIPVARKKGKRQAEEQIRLVHAAILDFRLKRGELFQRSDMVVPEIVASLVTEVIAVDSATLAYDVPGILKEYYTRLEEVNSPDRPKSLFNIKKTLEAKRQGLEAEIARLVTGKPNVSLSAASYPWYSHTKIHLERRTREEVHAGVVTGPGDVGNMEVSIIPYTVNIPDHTRHLNWVVSEIPVNDENAAGLFHLQVTVTSSETAGGDPNVEPHTSPDDDYEKTHHQEAMKALDNKLIDYNATVDAIVSIRRLESIAAAGRALIVKWNFADAKRLAASIKTNDFTAQTLLNDIDRRQRERQSQGATDAQTAARENAERVTADGFKRVEAAMEEVRKNKWRSDFATFVTVLNQSYNFYTVVKPYFQSTPTGKQETSKGGTQSPTAGKAAATPSNGKQKEKTAATIRKPEGSGFSLAQKPEELERKLGMTLAEVAKHPASSWKQIPNELTQQEIQLMEVEQTLRVLPETEVDKMASTSKDQVLEAAKDGTKGFASGGPVGAAKAVLKDSLKPTYTYDDEPLNAKSRQSLANTTRQLMQEFFDARFGKVSQNLGTSPTRDLSNKCLDPRGCYMPNNRP